MRLHLLGLQLLVKLAGKPNPNEVDLHAGCIGGYATRSNTAARCDVRLPPGAQVVGLRLRPGDLEDEIGLENGRDGGSNSPPRGRIS